MDELKKQAAELGIKVDGRWSADRLQAEIDEALDAPAPVVTEDQTEEVVDTAPDEHEVVEPEPRASAMTLTNLTENPMKRYGLQAGGSVELTEMQMSDEQFMKRIMRGVETGVMSLG